MEGLLNGTATAVLAILVALTSTATAQPPAAVDYDEEAEQHSEFWERAVAASDEGYDERIELARAYLEGGDRESLELAETELKTAIAAAPRRPEAHYFLGKVHEKGSDWAACAAALTEVFRHDPGWVPAVGRSPAAWTLDYELGLCLTRAGRFERAADHFRRILSAGHTGVSSVYWRLGEAYMGLGRLEEAIDTLETAVRMSSSAAIRFTLAVAYDRAEELVKGRDVLELALARDPRLGSLLSVSRVYSPRSDEHYYLGLAYAGGGQRNRALYHFRRYLAVAEQSPWAERARTHAELLSDAPLGADLSVRGSATLDLPRARRAIAASADRFERCFAESGDVLLEVSVTALAHRGRTASSVRPGVRVVILDQADVDTETLREVVRCTEAAARALSLPRPSGDAGSYVEAQFSLIAR